MFNFPLERFRLQTNKNLYELQKRSIYIFLRLLFRLFDFLNKGNLFLFKSTNIFRQDRTLFFFH